MSIRYRNLGASKRLSEIVFAGSHDASITSGSSSAQTQSLDIARQADAGVRIFDLRILARKVTGGAELVGYHGSPGGKKKGVFTSHVTGKSHNINTNSRITGEFGLTLPNMLRQAKKFVEDTDEFLIFKFDKCTNYKVIADYCVELLGDNIYKPIGIEFGKLTLDDVKNKVICVFNDRELSEMKPLSEADGILGFKSLKGENNSVGIYEPKYSGMQYYGKGGTNWAKFYQTDTMKMNDNADIQRRMLLVMANQQDDSVANVLGMMYWTATGSVTSIRDRNENSMWGATGVRRMGELWREGLEASIATQLARDSLRVLEYGGVRRIKAYFPNIIMIDFADEGKCQTIYDLNTTVDDKLAKAYDKYREGG